MRLSLLMKVVMGCCLFICKPTFSRNKASRLDRGDNFLSNFSNNVHKKTATPEERLTKQTQGYLRRPGKREEKLQHKHAHINSAATNSYFYPTTTSFGLSVCYKINDKDTFYVGVSCNAVWGKDFKNIYTTTEGTGLRSFFDIKIKNSFYANGGLNLIANQVCPREQITEAK